MCSVTSICVRPSPPHVMQALTGARGKSRRPLPQVEIAVQLGQACETDAVLVMARPDALEQAPFDHVLNRTHRRIDDRLEDGVDQRGHRFALSRRLDGDERPLPLVRLDQDELAARHQTAPGSLEGMDHALDCDSSKRPAEEHNLEWLATKGELLGGADAEGHVGDAVRRSQTSGLGDLRRIRFDGDNAGRKGRVLAGEPAVSASNLENPATLESNEALDEPDLHPGRRIVRAGLNVSRHKGMLPSRHASGRPAVRKIARQSSSFLKRGVRDDRSPPCISWLGPARLHGRGAQAEACVSVSADHLQRRRPRRPRLTSRSLAFR
jgi:hypothetical protein